MLSQLKQSDRQRLFIVSFAEFRNLKRARNDPFENFVRPGTITNNIPAYGGMLAHPKFGFQFKDSNPSLVHGVLEKGDIAILMSDGIPDGVHVSGDEMADELPKVIKGLRERDLTPSQIVQGILKELASTPDDLVIMAFRR